MISARHVFHTPVTGLDRAHAWQEATGEPVFLWGRGSGIDDSLFFGPLKKVFNKWIQATGGENALTVYHDGIGSDALGPLDPSNEKVLFLHNWFPRWEGHFEWTLRCTGKVMVGDPGALQTLRDRFAWIPERFIHVVPQPMLESLDEQASHPHATARRTGIWLHGTPWKRFGNRLRSIVDRWDSRSGELEIISGNGNQPSWSRKEGIIWNSDMPTEFALHRIFTWDSTLLLNDYSLDAPWFLRSLALDCFPLVPDGESPAFSPAWQADAAPRRYAWGNTNDAQSLLKEWREAKESLLPDFLQWRDRLINPHPHSHAFPEIWGTAKEAVLAQRTPQLRQRRPVGGWQFVSWYERVLRLRSGM